jgi:regulator of protease activity HflC (stomatin/prohibitin superfamily)
MFQALIDYVADIRDLLKPWAIINEYERGIILRVGKYCKNVNPGFTLKWPFLDVAISETVVMTTLRPQSQTITTCDKQEIVITPVIRYEIKDIKSYLLDMYDHKETIGDIVQGAVKSIVEQHPYDHICINDIQGEVLRQVRKELNQYGVKIAKITFVDQAKMKSIRVLLGSKQYSEDT